MLAQRSASSAQVVLCNTLGRISRRPLHLRTMGAVTLHGSQLADCAHGMAVRFEFGAGGLSVWLPPQDWQALLGPVCWEALDDTLQALFVMDHAMAWIEPLERHLGALQAVTVQPPGTMTLRCIALRVALPNDAREAQMLIEADDQLAMSVSPALQALADRAPPTPVDHPAQAATKISLWILLPALCADEATLSRLQAGAVLLLRDHLSQALIRADDPDWPVWIGLNHRPLWLARLNQAELRITETLPALSDPEMPDNTTPPATLASSPTTVTLSFRLARHSLSATQLAELGPGHVFELAHPETHARVDICVGDQRIGRGQVVAIGEHLGVEVLSWMTDHD